MRALGPEAGADDGKGGRVYVVSAARIPVDQKPCFLSGDPFDKRFNLANERIDITFLGAASIRNRRVLVAGVVSERPQKANGPPAGHRVYFIRADSDRETKINKIGGREFGDHCDPVTGTCHRFDTFDDGSRLPTADHRPAALGFEAGSVKLLWKRDHF